MKISEIKYERYLIEDFCQMVIPQIERLSKETDIDKFMSLRKIINAECKKFSTSSSLAFIRYTLDTRDKFYADEYAYYNKTSAEASEISRKYSEALLNSPIRKKLEEVLPETIFLSAELSKIINDPRIASDKIKESELVMEYENLMSGLMFDFKGESIPLSMLQKYFQDSDRQTRKDAFEVLGIGLEKVSASLDEIYDKLVHIRDGMAKKLGYNNFIQLGYYRMNRFDYTPKMIEEFRNNVKKHIVPKLVEIKKRTQEDFGFDKYMFYDSEVCLKDGEPKPMLDKNGIFFEAKGMYKEIHPLLGEFMERMIACEAIDADAREGKYGGGYASSLDAYEQPFILTNFNGTSADIDVITHEFGHAFAMEESYKMGIYEVGIGNAETAECHSMSMEMLCHKFMDRFFGIDAKKYRFKHIYSSFEFFSFGTIIDEFQHEVYKNPNMTPSERNSVYLEIEKKYRPYLSFEGIKYLEKGTRWQYKAHPFVSPFYYIDYCLAQTVAFSFLIKSMENYDDALRIYLDFTRKGGTKKFEDLCESAGIGSPFCEDTIKEIAEKIPQILKELIGN